MNYITFISHITSYHYKSSVIQCMSQSIPADLRFVVYAVEDKEKDLSLAESLKRLWQ